MMATRNQVQSRTFVCLCGKGPADLFNPSLATMVFVDFSAFLVFTMAALAVARPV
ncbi:hypothetical protein K438DRAFT_1932671, partial [Mycena galopus ATCC 62051]